MKLHIAKMIIERSNNEFNPYAALINGVDRVKANTAPYTPTNNAAAKKYGQRLVIQKQINQVKSQRTSDAIKAGAKAAGRFLTFRKYE